MKLTPKEAKAKCIKMWNYLAENITIPEWRANTYLTDYKRLAYEELWPKKEETHNFCFLCELYHYVNQICEGCPLSKGKCRGCLADGQPYLTYLDAEDNKDYLRASEAALKLVKMVKAWKVK